MAPGVSSCHYREVPPSISFSGSGFMSTYQLGVAQCFLTYTPWILRTAPQVLGASAGSLVAATVVCGISPGEFPLNVSPPLFLCHCLFIFIHLKFTTSVDSFHQEWDDRFCQANEGVHPGTIQPLSEYFPMAGGLFKQSHPWQRAPVGQRPPGCGCHPDGWSEARHHLQLWLQRRRNKCKWVPKDEKVPFYYMLMSGNENNKGRTKW